MPSLERRTIGVDAEISVGMVECRKVMGRIDDGQSSDGRARREARSERGGWVVGVRMSLVRTMSSGASRIPAMLDAATAMPMEAKGDGESVTSTPPERRPGSEMLKTAARRERVQDSTVLRRME
jgi:hypothetical protein